MCRTGKILSEKKSRGGEMDMHRFLFLDCHDSRNCQIFSKSSSFLSFGDKCRIKSLEECIFIKFQT